MSDRVETKRRRLVVSLWELVEAAAGVTEDAAELAAVVEHILRTRTNAAVRVPVESGPVRSARSVSQRRRANSRRGCE